MTELTTPQSRISGKIVATDVSEADYMETYAESFHEWIEGVVIKMSPASYVHERFTRYLDKLLEAYLLATGLSGDIISAPFVMRLEHSRHEPDILLVLGENQANRKATYMDGPADICIEVISPGTVGTDYGDKLIEYEQGGVQEYWIVDPQRKRCLFNRLSEDNTYIVVPVNESGDYTTPLLPGFRLHEPTLWQDELPNYQEVWQMVQTMK